MIEIENLTPLQIIDKVEQHLLIQNKKCVDDYNRPKYKYNGLSCAIGCLIPNEKYTKDIEYRSVTALMCSYDVFKTYTSNRAIVILLDKLQRIHDSCEIEDWKNELKLIREEFKDK